MYKNMKILITEDQPLDEVVRELENKGLKKVEIVNAEKGVNIYVDSNRSEFFEDRRNLGFYALTTLAELKEME